jgi:hypothetical protein
LGWKIKKEICLKWKEKIKQMLRERQMVQMGRRL